MQKSIVKYHFSFRILLNRNMKMVCQEISFLQRLNLVPRGYIILDRTHSFHGIFWWFARKSAETFNLRKILSPMKLDEKAGILRCKRIKTIIHCRKYIHFTYAAHFCHDSNVRHFYPHNHKCQFDVKRGCLSLQVAPKISC